MPREINDYRGFNEANIRNNKGTDRDYIDRIRDTEKQEAHRKTRSREVEPISAIMPMVGEIMEIQGGRLQHTEQGPVPVWLDQEKKERINELARAIINDRYGRLLKYFNIEMDIALIGDDELIEMKNGCEMCDKTEPPEYEETDDESLRNDIDKRKIVNIITQGSAKNVHRLIHMYRDQIENLDPRLFELMDKLIKTNEVAEWMHPENENSGKMIRQYMNGYTKTEFEDNDVEAKFKELKDDFDVESLLSEDEDFDDDLDSNDFDGAVKVQARGIDLVILLHEAVKGIFEVLGAPSLPEYDEQRANDIMANTDTLLDEFEDLRYGPKIREDLLDWVNTNNKINQIDDGFERLWRKMAGLPSNQFLAIFFDAIISKTGRADKRLDAMLNEMIELENEQREYDQKLAEWEKDQKETKADSKLYTPTPTPTETEEVPSADIEVNYAEMTQRDLGNLRDQLLDAEDFTALAKITKYLK